MRARRTDSQTSALAWLRLIFQYTEKERKERAVKDCGGGKANESKWPEQQLDERVVYTVSVASVCRLALQTAGVRQPLFCNDAFMTAV